MSKKTLSLLAVFGTLSVSFSQTVVPTLKINVTKSKESERNKPVVSSKELKSLKKKHNFNSGIFYHTIDKKQLDLNSPAEGAGAALRFAPGVNVYGASSFGGDRQSIVINGIRQGWVGFSNISSIDQGSLSVTFDGIPLANPNTGLWQSPQIPQLGIIQGINVVYGPGNPLDRWYNNIGGQIEFVPLQPTKDFNSSLSLSLGSYSARNVFFSLNTGNIRGWYTTIAGGYGQTNSFRTSPDGFRWPAHDYAFYIKTVRPFSMGDISFGAYEAYSQRYRPIPIPISPVPQVTLDSTPNTSLYSQETSGFYSTVDYYAWWKRTSNQVLLIYNKLNLNISKELKFHNYIWYRNAHRLHVHYNAYSAGQTSLYPGPDNLLEYNNPRTTYYGDKIWFDIKPIKYNYFSIGGFFLKSDYETINHFWNPNPPYYGSLSKPNKSYRDNHFYQTDVAGFIEDKISPIEKFNITPGLRIINYQTEYSAGNSIPGAKGKNQGIQAGIISANKNFTKIEPSVEVNYKPKKWINLFANFSETYKEPPVGGGGGLFQAVPPIYNLEFATYYSAGIKTYLKNLKFGKELFLSTSIFHLRFANMYIPIYNTNGDFLGAGTGTSIYNGLDASLDYELNNFIGLFSTLSLEHGYFKNYNNSGIVYDGSPVSYVPAQTFNIGTYYKTFYKRVAIESKIWDQFTGTQHIFDNNLGAPSSLNMPPYNTINAAINFDIPTDILYTKRINLDLEIYNILNKKYNDFEYVSSGGLFGTPNGGYVLAYPGAPLTFYITAKAEF